MQKVYHISLKTEIIYSIGRSREESDFQQYLLEVFSNKKKITHYYSLFDSIIELEALN